MRAGAAGQPLEQRILITATLCLLGFGAVMVYSASSATTLLQGHGNGSGYLVRFLIYGTIGLVAMRVLARDGVSKVHQVDSKVYFEIPAELLGRDMFWQTEVAEVSLNGQAVLLASCSL